MITTATLPIGRSVRLAVPMAGFGSSFIRVSPSFEWKAICPTGSHLSATDRLRGRQLSAGQSSAVLPGGLFGPLWVTRRGVNLEG